MTRVALEPPACAITGQCRRENIYLRVGVKRLTGAERRLTHSGKRVHTMRAKRFRSCVIGASVIAVVRERSKNENTARGWKTVGAMRPGEPGVC